MRDFGYTSLVAQFWWGFCSTSFFDSFGYVSLVWGFGFTSLVALFWLSDFGGGFDARLCEFGCVSLARVS